LGFVSPYSPYLAQTKFVEVDSIITQEYSTYFYLMLLLFPQRILALFVLAAFV
jgi:hypothetical protein